MGVTDSKKAKQKETSHEVFPRGAVAIGSGGGGGLQGEPQRGQGAAAGPWSGARCYSSRAWQRPCHFAAYKSL